MLGALTLSTVPGSDASRVGSSRRATSAAVAQCGGEDADGATPAPDGHRIRTLSDTAMARAPNVEAVSAAPAVPEWRTA